MRLVIHNGSRAWGGNEKWLALVARGLLERGHRVVVACRPAGPVREELERRGIPTAGVRPGGDLDLPAAFRFARWLRSERPDAVLLTTWNRIYWGGWAARRAGVGRVVVRLGIVRPLPGMGKYRHAFRRYVDAMIVNSTEIEATWHRTASGLPPGGVHVIRNGIEARPGRSNALRAELGIGAEVPLVAGVGRLTPRKGFDLLLEALARVPDRGARVAIAGAGEAEGELRALADALGVADRVHWLGFRHDVDAVLAGSDIFVLSSRNEGMANAMLEAMAAGALVVAAEVAGVREALGAREGRPAAGWIVRPDDVASLTSGLTAALDAIRTAPAVADAMRAEARARITEWFGVGRMLDEVERVLFGVAGSGAGGVGGHAGGRGAVGGSTAHGVAAV